MTSPPPRPHAGLPARDDDASSADHAPASATDVAAADWDTRAGAGLSATERGQYLQWLHASPAHARAIQRLDATMSAVRALRPAWPAPASAAGTPPSPGPTRRPTAPPASHRRPGVGWLAGPAAWGVGAAMGVVVALAAHTWRQPTFSSPYASAPAQRLNVQLPDGSRLELDADTRLDVALYRDRREVHVRDGQALFDVAPDRARPFRVRAGDAEVTVVGTRFVVRHRLTGAHAGDVGVVVEEGRVVVRRRPPGDGDGDALKVAHTLGANQALDLAADGSSGAPRTVSAASIAPWRRGMVRFDGTPLADALAELAHYGPVRLVVRDPAVAALPIAGTFRLGQPDAFADVLPRILPVRLQRQADGTSEVVAAP